jgi:dipeptidyl aminopeptidase/acylaminoacyl peptidase
METARGVLRRLTSGESSEGTPSWSPDGKRLAFNSRRTGPQNVWVKSIDGGPEERVLQSAQNQVPTDWSPDGRFILYDNDGQVWAVPVSSNEKSFKVIETEFNNGAGRFSPDGRWIAYESMETGRYEVYVRPFPGPGPALHISLNGGTAPQWRNDAREIFYLAPDNRLLAVPVTLEPKGEPPELGTPVALFSIPPYSPYDVAPDGQRVLISYPVGEATTPPIRLLLNWKLKP